MTRFIFLTPFFLVAIFFYSCEKKIGKVDANYVPINCDTITFSKNIKPIINASCAKSGCHVTGFANGDYTTYAGLYAKVSAGTFKLRVFDSPNNPMPQDNGMLPPAKLAILKCWLDKGAPND